MNIQKSQLEDIIKRHTDDKGNIKDHWGMLVDLLDMLGCTVTLGVKSSED